jgi:hypothetical protein
LDILRAQGYAACTPDVRTGRVRVWILGSDETVEVAIGRGLHELAEGKLTFEDIRARREDEAVFVLGERHQPVSRRALASSFNPWPFE